MNDQFATKIYPVFDFVLELLDRIESRDRKDPDPSKILPRVKQILAGMEGEGADRKALDLAKRAMVYWTDEVLVNSNWSRAKDWQNNTLERELYDTRDRAWKFFDAARSARAFTSPDALETFYLCVALGFRGLYRDKGGAAPTSPSAPTAKPSTPPPPAKKGAPPTSMTWFGDSKVFNSEETWGLGNLPKATSEDSMFDSSLMSPSAGVTGDDNHDLPRTLEEWAGPVFAQVAPPVMKNFVPSHTAERQRDARPLYNKLSCQRALRILFGSSVVTVMLLVVWVLASS